MSQVEEDQVVALYSSDNDSDIIDVEQLLSSVRHSSPVSTVSRQRKVRSKWTRKPKNAATASSSEEDVIDVDEVLSRPVFPQEHQKSKVAQGSSDDDLSSSFPLQDFEGCADSFPSSLEVPEELSTSRKKQPTCPTKRASPDALSSKALTCSLENTSCAGELKKRATKSRQEQLSRKRKATTDECLQEVVLRVDARFLQTESTAAFYHQMRNFG